MTLKRHQFLLIIEKRYMGVSKNKGFSPQIIRFNRVFRYINHPFWGTTIFGNTHIQLNYTPEV